MSSAIPEIVTPDPSAISSDLDPFAPLSASFELLEDSVVVFSADGELAIWNGGAENLFGYTFEEAARKDISFLSPPEDSGDTIKLFARALSGQPVPPRLVNRVHKDGSRLRISLRVSPLRDAAGQVFGVVFMGRNVIPEIERENRLTELQLREREIATLVPDALFIHRNGKIIWANDAAVEMFAARSLTDLLGRNSFEMIVEEDLALVLERHSKLGEAGKTNPVFVHRKRLDGSVFPSEGRGAVISWENEPATLMVVRDLSEQERTITALAESEARQKELAEICPDAILVHIDGEIIFANDAAVDMFGAENVRDLIGRTNESLVHPDDWKQIEQSWTDTSDLGPGETLNVRQVRLDGTIFLGEGRGKAVTWEGQGAWIVVIRNVTEQVRTKTALIESETRQRDFAEISPDAMLVHLDGEIVFANEAALSLFGAEDSSEFLGRDVAETIHPDDRQIIRNNWVTWRKGEGQEVVEARRLRLDGTSFYGEGRFRSIFWDGQPAYLVVVRDISEQKAAQIALSESEERYRQIVDVTPDSVLIHIDDEIVFANASAVQTFGAHDANDLIGRRSLELIPEDQQELALARRKQVQEEGVVSLAEVRRRRLDGSEFIAEATGSQYTWNDRPAVLTILRDVTDRFEAERERFVLEQRFQKILELTPEATFIHVGGKLVYVNPASVEMFGAESAEQLIGMEIEKLVHPDDRDRMIEQRKVLLEGETMPVSDVRRLRIDGSEFESRATGAAIDWDGEIGFLVIARDVTSELAAQQALQESEDRHRMISEASPDAIIVHVDRKIVFANKAAAEMFRVEVPSDLFGRRAIDLVHPEDQEALLKSNRVLAPGEIIGAHVSRRLRDDGDVFFSESIRSGYLWNAQPAVMAVIRDISERHEAELKQLEHAEALERINEELGRFAYVASHDLKEPLRMVSSFCELLQERYAAQLDDQAREYIRFAVDGAKRMHGLIEDLLRLSRTGTADLVAEEVAVSDVLCTVEANLASQIADANAQIEYGDMPRVVGDRTLLTQLFQNLISNAIKFRSDAVLVVEVTAQQQDEDCIFSVSDNGIGLDPKHHQRIFDVFKTLHARDAFDGNGVGLSICEKVVERHGGRIWVESQSGEGTTFHFTLPITPNRKPSRVLENETA